MPNIIDANGIQIKELQEIVSDLNTELRNIYGPDTNLDPETPDAQMVMIFSQVIRDIEELILGVNASFDPDQAEGRILDQRCAINGVQRQEGTSSITNIDITVDRQVNLYGLDHPGSEQKFIVEDNVGTKWILRNTAQILVAGTVTLSFQSVDVGQVLSLPNTITNPVTIVNGVIAINNPYQLTTVGQGEESDAVLKTRRRQSVALSSQGFREGLLASLRNISGMLDAWVYENKTSEDPDSQGIPSHSIWVVTDGTSADEDIAMAIYRKRNAGCGLKQGSKSFNVTEIDGQIFTATWDEVVLSSLYIKFTVTPINPGNPVAIDVIKLRLPEIYRPGVGGKVDINGLASAVQSIDPNALVTDAGFSTSPSGTFTPTLSPGLNERFNIVSSNIIILPIEILPRVPNVPVSTDFTFSAQGGYGVYSYSIDSGPGTINSTTGLFNSGVIGTSVIRVTDDLGNTSTKSVQVT